MSLRHFYNSQLSLSALFPADATELTSQQHESAIAEIQQFRGGVYLRDGAIPAEALDESGRHQSDADYSSYHLLIRTSSQQVCACLRIHWHGLSGDYESLDCQQYFARMSPGVARTYAQAAREFITLRDYDPLALSEVGGWAGSEAFRSTRVASTLPPAAWALCGLLGHCRAISFATDRHSSAAILRQMGGFELTCGGQPLPEFFDPFYGCRLHLLGFDSRYASPRYTEMIEAIKAYLAPLLPQTVSDQGGAASICPSRESV